MVFFNGFLMVRNLVFYVPWGCRHVLVRAEEYVSTYINNTNIEFEGGENVPTYLSTNRPLSKAPMVRGSSDDAVNAVSARRRAREAHGRDQRQRGFPAVRKAGQGLARPGHD